MLTIGNARSPDHIQRLGGVDLRLRPNPIRLPGWATTELGMVIGGAFGGRPAGALLLAKRRTGDGARDLGAEKKNLRGIVGPQQNKHEGPGGAVGRAAIPTQWPTAANQSERLLKQRLNASMQHPTPSGTSRVSISACGYGKLSRPAMP